MALHYLLINKHLTKLCKIKKENIPSDFDEPQPMDDMMKEELLKFNIEFFNTILIVALRKENTITVNGSTFSYANAVSQDDHKKKQVNEEDKEMTYKNLMDLVVNIIIYTQWCKVKLSEGCSILIDNKEWMINLKEVLKIVNDIAPIKVETLINNKKQELFVSENGYFLFKNAVYLRGFIPLLDNDAHNNEKVLGTSYYKNFEDILSNTNDVVNNQIQYLIKLAYELSSISNGNLLFSLKENPINHKVKLIFTNSKEEALKINGVNVLTGKTSYESLSNLNDENNDNDDDDDDSMTETIVFTGRNKGNKTPPNEPKAENKVVEQTINKNSEPSNHESNKGDSVSEKIPKPLTINKMTDSNKGKSDLPIKRIIDEKDDDLDISMDIKNIIGDTCELPSEQTNNYRNDTNVMNLMENINNQTPSTAFISNTTTPSGLFSPFDWNKDYAYPFTNSSSIIPVQNPNKTGNDPLNTSRKDSSHDKLKEKGNTPVDFGYKWLQNQNMYAQPSNYIGNKHKSYDENTLNMPKIMNTEDHPSIPPGLSVQTKNKVPQMFNSSAPSSANSDNFVSADIFNRIENQSKLNTPITSNSNYNISNKNDDGNTISPNEFNPLQPPTQKASTVPTQSIPSQSSSSQNQPTSTTPHAPLQSPQSNVQPIQPPTQDFSSLNSSNLTTPIGLTESPSQNLLNNPLFMPPKPQTSLTFPPFPNPQITPQKQNLSSQQSTPSHLQSPLYLQNNSSSINSPVTQIFLTNQIPPPFQSLVQNSNMNNSPEQLQTTSGTKPLPNSTLQNPLFSLPYTSQIYPPGFNPSLLQAQSQSQPPSQPLTSLPNNLTGNNLAGNIPKNLPGTMPVNSNIPMPLGMGTMNNNLFGNVPLANFPNVDPRLMGMPSNPTNLNPLNNLLLNPAAALQSLASSNHQAPPNSMVPPMNLPLGMNVNPPNSTHPISQSSTSVSDGNGNSNDNGNNNGNPQAVNPLFFLNNPLSFNSVGNGMFYDDNTTSTNNLKPI
ncbi:hypothetical protein BCR36DRAFT_398849 [Piromyces finnis]|uniref:Uncharacterized protein n=1 Tax=Piromyces finnis TaxID=1754191 RepID=A0A1Y1V3L4_9FUNG|nr:hypothetical protein BCR36DRAFT_398849 [Piromyces finnis]|eukprot:ORX46415.1 hypothetical protein BCR36DRAFT_398849 [Piromyces finnis]